LEETYKKKHDEQPNDREDGPAINRDREANDELNGNDGDLNTENVEDRTKSGALYILKLQEDCCLPKSTVEIVLSNTTAIVKETVSAVKTQVQDCLVNADIDFQTVPGLREIFEQDNAATNPFSNLDTETRRLAYYKDNFGLKVWSMDRV
jgi:hypothetical protein